LYIRDSQDEKWLKSRQKKTVNTINVSSIDDIKQHLGQASLNYLNVEE
jgi:hypothetical protein